MQQFSDRQGRFVDRFVVGRDKFPWKNLHDTSANRATFVSVVSVTCVRAWDWPIVSSMQQLHDDYLPNTLAVQYTSLFTMSAMLVDGPRSTGLSLQIKQRERESVLHYTSCVSI